MSRTIKDAILVVVHDDDLENRKAHVLTCVTPHTCAEDL